MLAVPQSESRISVENSFLSALNSNLIRTSGTELQQFLILLILPSCSLIYKPSSTANCVVQIIRLVPVLLSIHSSGDRVLYHPCSADHRGLCPCIFYSIESLKRVATFHVVRLNSTCPAPLYHSLCNV